MGKKEFWAVSLNTVDSEQQNKAFLFISLFLCFILQRSNQAVDSDHEFISNSSPVQSQRDVSMRSLHILSPV